MQEEPLQQVHRDVEVMITRFVAKGQSANLVKAVRLYHNPMASSNLAAFCRGEQGRVFRGSSCRNASSSRPTSLIAAVASGDENCKWVARKKEPVWPLGSNNMRIYGTCTSYSLGCWCPSWSTWSGRLECHPRIRHSLRLHTGRLRRSWAIFCNWFRRSVISKV